MADSYTNLYVTQGAPYTVPANKALFFRMYGQPFRNLGARAAIMTAGAIQKSVAQACVDSIGTYDEPGEIIGVATAGAVLSGAAP